MDPQALCHRWRAALNASEAALAASGRAFSASERAARTARIAADRVEALRLIAAIARERRSGGRFLHLRSAKGTRQLLGLRDDVAACVFGLEGVLIAVLHVGEEQGVRSFAGSHNYLEFAREVGVRTAVVSASANTPSILRAAGLDGLVDACVDGNAIAACRALSVEPGAAVAFETSPAGVSGACAAGFRAVIGVDAGGHADALLSAGATGVVHGLAELLERGLDG